MKRLSISQHEIYQYMWSPWLPSVGSEGGKKTNESVHEWNVLHSPLCDCYPHSRSLNPMQSGLQLVQVSLQINWKKQWPSNPYLILNCSLPFKHPLGNKYTNARCLHTCIKIFSNSIWQGIDFHNICILYIYPCMGVVIWPKSKAKVSSHKALARRPMFLHTNIEPQRSAICVLQVCTRSQQPIRV